MRNTSECAALLLTELAVLLRAKSYNFPKYQLTSSVELFRSRIPYYGEVGFSYLMQVMFFGDTLIDRFLRFHVVVVMKKNAFLMIRLAKNGSLFSTLIFFLFQKNTEIS